MKIKQIPEEMKKGLYLLKEELWAARKDLDKVVLLAQEKRQEVQRLQNELSLRARDISIAVGGNTNWQIDDDGENVVLVDRFSPNQY
jgi:hypothetical protein